jgi:hypothetical protein
MIITVGSASDSWMSVPNGTGGYHYINAPVIPAPEPASKFDLIALSISHAKLAERVRKLEELVEKLMGGGDDRAA